MACLSGSWGIMRLYDSGTTNFQKKINDLSSASASLCLRSSDVGRSGSRSRRRVNNNNNNNEIKAVMGKFKGTQMREKQLTEMIEKKVMEAKEVCQQQQGQGLTDECKVAWDEVEEVSQAKADLRLKLEKNKDPLESFCHDNPETDECRIYED